MSLSCRVYLLNNNAGHATFNFISVKIVSWRRMFRALGFLFFPNCRYCPCKPQNFLVSMQITRNPFFVCFQHSWGRSRNMWSFSLWTSFDGSFSLSTPVLLSWTQWIRSVAFGWIIYQGKHSVCLVLNVWYVCIRFQFLHNFYWISSYHHQSIVAVTANNIWWKTGCLVFRFQKRSLRVSRKYSKNTRLAFSPNTVRIIVFLINSWL